MSFAKNAGEKTMNKRTPSAQDNGAEDELSQLLGRPIAFHRTLVLLTGSLTAALMLSQAIYWQKRVTSADGWWWKTREQWNEETGLTRTEQETARRYLRQHAWWQEELRGLPARMYFRVDLDALADALRRITSQGRKGLGEGEALAPGRSSAGRNAPSPEGGRKPADISEITSEITTENTPYPPLSSREGGVENAPDGALPADAGPPPSPVPPICGKLTGMRKRDIDARILGTAIDAWNRICGDVLPKVRKLTEARARALRRRLVDDCGGSLQAWEAYCRRIRSSPFLCGQNDRGWVATIEFALRPSSYAKVIEGNYDCRQPVARDDRSAWLDGYARALGGSFDRALADGEP